MNITFVCSGNTCRSPMAEGLFKKIAEERNIKDWNITSCGLSASSYGWASPKAVSAVKEYGVNISSHRSKGLTRSLIESTDLFVCMTKYYREEVEHLSSKNNVIVLGEGIEDPYGQEYEVYCECAAELYDALLLLADVLQAEIIPMDESCIDGVTSIEKECFSVPWSRESVAAELDNETAHFLAAKLHSDIIGYIGVHEVAGEAYISNIAVIEKYRCMHLGTRLMDCAEKGAMSRNCDFISLEVRKSNKNAIAMYSGRGYTVAGERKNFYSNPSEDGIIMTLYF